jgi:DNA invertase Pin-like site-specific DNA recombinase
MSKRVIGYVRVSTAGQAESGLSIEAQRSKIEAYCGLYDLELVEIIVDAGESAKSLKRPGIDRLLSAVAAGSLDGVVVAKLDRLTRSMRDLHRLLEEVFSKVELHSVAEKVDTSSAAGRLVLNVLMSVAEWEREAIGERTATALKAKKARGEKVGRAPYGFRWEDGELVKDETEQKTVAVIKELRSRGLTLRAIKGEIEERGLLNRSGVARWSLAVLSKVAA